MLKPTRAEIVAQGDNLASDGTLEPEDQKDWIALVRQLPEYTSRAYQNLATALAEVKDYEAQQLLAALARIEALDQDMDRIAVEGIVTSYEENDRLAWVRFGLSVLFDGKLVGTAMSVGRPYTSRWSVCSGCGLAPCGCERSRVIL